MLHKTFQLKEPIGQYIVPLELFLTDVSKNVLQSASGRYLGTGVAGLKIATTFPPKFIVISPLINISTSATTIAGNMVFSMAANPGASWLPGTGFQKDCVTSFLPDGFTVGINMAVNSINVSYLYFMVG